MLGIFIIRKEKEAVGLLPFLIYGLMMSLMGATDQPHNFAVTAEGNKSFMSKEIVNDEIEETVYRYSGPQSKKGRSYWVSVTQVHKAY